VIFSTSAAYVRQAFQNGPVSREINVIGWSNGDVSIVRVVLLQVPEEFEDLVFANAKVFVA
jgi:hypothetical protein